MPAEQRRSRIRDRGNPPAGGLDQFSQVSEQRRLIHDDKHLCLIGMAGVLLPPRLSRSGLEFLGRSSGLLLHR
jgi:hypothetical protein